MRICLIFNPTAQGERARRWLPHLREFSKRCELRPTDGPQAGRTLAKAAVLEGFDTVVAAGGDGTVNEVLNGIADVPWGFEKVRLGVLPMGTINVFARELGIPAQPEQAWRMVLSGEDRLLDLPVVELQGRDGNERRHFIQLAGAGLDARAVELVSWRLKKKLGMAAYVLATLQAYGGKPHCISVISEGSTSVGKAVLVGNGRLYGGNHAVFHKALSDDGLLDICLFKRIDALTLVQALLAVLTGNWRRVSGVEYAQASEFRLTGETRTPVELEGDPVGELPARFKVGPVKARVLAPLRPHPPRGRISG